MVFGHNNMSLDLPPLKIPTLLRKYGLRPKKRLGQNFLIDNAALHKIISAAQISGDEMVLEIGPGLGSLTRLLAVTAQEVIAVELDKNFITPLQEVIAPFDNVTVIQGDILAQDIKSLVQNQGSAGTKAQYAVIANIPYYITSALIRHLLEAPVKPSRMVLTIQKEVATRICANPPKMSLLALSVQVYGQPQIAAKIPAGAFYPAPNIDSAVIRIDLFDTPVIPPPFTDIFFKLAKAGFSQKRKNLRNSLSAGLGQSKEMIVALLHSVGVDPKRRAETLNLAEWGSLAVNYSEQFLERAAPHKRE
jgi:16S rRNA (adenine1518-N6/adenine1519-N6)-dimethyltransferase